MIAQFLSTRIGERKNIIEELIFNDTSNSYEYGLSSGNFNLKNWNNGVTSNSDRFGNPHRAAQFNGATIGQEAKYINLITNNITLHVQLTRDRANDYEKIIEAVGQNGTKFFLFLQSITYDFFFRGYWYTFGYNSNEIGVSKLLSFTADDNYLKFYNNGIFIQQYPVEQNAIEIALYSTLGSQFQGKIDFFQLKNTTDTAEQVKNLANELQYNKLL